MSQSSSDDDEVTIISGVILLVLLPPPARTPGEDDASRGGIGGGGGRSTPPADRRVDLPLARAPLTRVSDARAALPAGEDWPAEPSSRCGTASSTFC